KLDKEKAEKMAKKLEKRGSFNFEDMLMQFEQMSKMGGMMGFLDKLPGMSNSGIQQALEQANPEKQVKKMEAIIQSMTVKERRNPDLINPSRKKRIAAGCGMDVSEVNKLIKQHAQMAKMMKKFSNPAGMSKMMRSLGNLQKQFGGGGGAGPLFGGNDPQKKP
ncbi:MAG TPA: signal recognition particle protein, partial [Acinetobacter radioresistens]|nr:signal recognition particle protein [Acinetobacter radioresistens]